MKDFKAWWREAEIFAGEGSMEAAEEAWDAAMEQQNEALMAQVKELTAKYDLAVGLLKASENSWNNLSLDSLKSKVEEETIARCIDHIDNSFEGSNGVCTMLDYMPRKYAKV